MSLFASVELVPGDPILGLTEAYNADPRTQKVNLGVGIYYDEQGRIPLLDCVRQVEQALELGLSTLKFFPAEASGGIAMLKALAAVYPVQFMPTGGVSPANLEKYLAQPNVIACGGSWMVPGDLIEQGDWPALHQLIADAVALSAQP